MRNALLKCALAASTAIGIVTPALAQADDAASGGDIIVTARRVEERLQDVPISITVLTPTDLANRNIVNAVDLATSTPSLTTNQRFGPEKSSFAIRGFTSESATAPTVGTYFADVIAPRAQGGTTSGNSLQAGSFMDLQNVQVLKGPQGTLFGRNTTGGAILVVPQKPTDRFEGYGEVTVGDYGLLRGQAVINVPVSDTLRFRLGGDTMVRDGYLKNQSGLGPKDYNNTNYKYVRASMVWDITPDIENYTVFHYSDSNTHGYAGKIVACDGSVGRPPAPVPSANAFSRANGAWSACAQMDRAAARGDGPWDVDVNGLTGSRVHIQQFQLINTTTFKVSDDITIKNIASYSEFKENTRNSFYNDNFFVPANPTQRWTVISLDTAKGKNTARQRTFTEELQIQGTTLNNRLTWVLGGYLEFSRPIGWNENVTGQFMNCTSPALPTNLNCTVGAGPLGSAASSYSLSRTQFKFDNHGIFGQATFNVTDQLGITLGGRYTFDKILAIGETTRLNFDAATQSYSRLNCNDVTRFFVRNPDGSPLLVSPAPGRPAVRQSLPVTSPSQCHVEIPNNSNKPTWLIEADYKVTPDVMVYAKYSRGYRQGGINLTNIGFESWRPESLDNYEIGLKSSFRGAVSGYFNIAGFYNDLKDQQVFGGLGSLDTSIVSGGSGIANAGKSRIQGFEVESSISPLDGLKFDVGYAYLDTKILEFVPPVVNFPFQGFFPRANVGDPLNFAPKHRLTVTGTYRLPLNEDMGRLSVGATYTYTSKQFVESGFSGIPVQFRNLPSYEVVNLNINWDKFMDSPVDLAVFVTNLTNNAYAVSAGNGWQSFGYTDWQYAPPRMFGVRARVNFGN
ncbi:MAG TPA: TonB-dependent receptor [Novosphingobium sp.]